MRLAGWVSARRLLLSRAIYSREAYLVRLSTCGPFSIDIHTSPVLWKEFFRFNGVWDGFRYKWGSSTFDQFSDIQSCDCRKGWVEHSRSLLMNGSYWCSRTSALSFLKSRLKAFLNWWSICSASINFAIADPAPALSQGSAALNHSKLRSKKWANFDILGGILYIH